MTLFFFPVSNPQGLTRHSFDNVDFDNAAERKQTLDTLTSMQGVRSYDITKNTYQSRTPCLCDFVEDFNNEEFDQQGFWVVAVPITEEDYLAYVQEKAESEVGLTKTAAEILAFVKEHKGETIAHLKRDEEEYMGEPTKCTDAEWEKCYEDTLEILEQRKDEDTRYDGATPLLALSDLLETQPDY